ncbi:UNVERIFIED_CONTAM: Purple acid phosphatase 17 [Sesamum angustifolium]|uniref:Purple acid phosphatase 17 n=1 Tax=Sesamum angustifolium TaxID=2727405 RepID=A0AAW2LI53_9LAMI
MCKISAEFQRFSQTDGTLRFLVVGDWGKKGEFNQSRVAFQMGRIGEELDIDFVVSTGDNFYDDGLEGKMIPTFLTLLPTFTLPTASRSNGLVVLEGALKESRAKWKIVVGHHPIRSVGHHGNTKELVDRLLPILRHNPILDKWRGLKGLEGRFRQSGRPEILQRWARVYVCSTYTK